MDEDLDIMLAEMLNKGMPSKHDAPPDVEAKEKTGTVWIPLRLYKWLNKHAGENGWKMIHLEQMPSPNHHCFVVGIWLAPHVRHAYWTSIGHKAVPDATVVSDAPAGFEAGSEALFYFIGCAQKPAQHAYSMAIGAPPESWAVVDKEIIQAMLDPRFFRDSMGWGVEDAGKDSYSVKEVPYYPKF